MVSLYNIGGSIIDAYPPVDLRDGALIVKISAIL